jgi:Zn finger protein HypA/HybF involved in hydrogenase expression
MDVTVGIQTRGGVATVQIKKKTVTNICRICGKDFHGEPSSYRCPNCKKEDERYKAQREKLRRSLPYYLKADI